MKNGTTNSTKKLGAVIGEYGAFIALIVLVVLLSAINADFRQPSNFTSLLRQATFNGLIAVGMTCVILSDGIDLSVGSIFALSAIICAQLIMAGLPAVLCVILALIAGTFWAASAASWSPRDGCRPSSPP